PDEWPLMRAGQTVFTYFHFAADEALTKAVMKSGITAVAYETIRDAKGTLPLLTPMSEVAGRMSIQEGAKYLERPFDGRGILLAGVPGVPPATVSVIGAGVVGANAARVAAGLGANVFILDVNLDRLRYIEDDIVHYCVTNMPGAVGRTSTYALTNVTLPYTVQLANKGAEKAVRENPALAAGVNVKAGQVTNAAVAETFGLECVPA